MNAPSKIIALTVLALGLGSAASASVSVTFADSGYGDVSYFVGGYNYDMRDANQAVYDFGTVSDPFQNSHFNSPVYTYGYSGAGGYASEVANANTSTLLDVSGFVQATTSAYLEPYSGNWEDGVNYNSYCNASSYLQFTLDNPGTLNFTFTYQDYSASGYYTDQHYVTIDGVQYTGDVSLNLAAGGHYLQEAVYSGSWAGSHFDQFDTFHQNLLTYGPYSTADSAIGYHLTISSAAVPEPATLVVLLTGVVALGRRRRRN